jgi:hypothetical protein
VVRAPAAMATNRHARHTFSNGTVARELQCTMPSKSVVLDGRRIKSVS